MNSSGKDYWEGMYWDGFSASDMGALPLSDVQCESDPITQNALDQCRNLVEKDDRGSVDEFYVTLDEESISIQSGLFSILF